MAAKAKKGNVPREVLSTCDPEFYRQIQISLKEHERKASENLQWLLDNLHPYFFITMQEEMEAIVNLAGRLHHVPYQWKVTLIDEEKKLIVARLDIPGSLYDTLKNLREREISYAEITHSYGRIPGAGRELEIQRFEFDRKTADQIGKASQRAVDREKKSAIIGVMKQLYPSFDFRQFDQALSLLSANNENYVKISPPERIARVLWLYQEGLNHDGLYLDVEKMSQQGRYRETRLLFSVGNPVQRGFLTQTSEVFQRLNIGVQRSYSLIINTGVAPYFLGTFYVTPRTGADMGKESELYRKLKTELYNTQILSASDRTYTHFVARGIMTGEEATLTNAFIAFCHTTLAHNQPDRFDMEVVKNAFHSDPEITLSLIHLFKTRFDPTFKKREAAFKKALKKTEEAVDRYNTGHRYLDEIRRTIFRACISFICHTLKTNFFVPEKHALAFRLDPAYLEELGREITEDLPKARPFRITFFFGQHGVGYHIGFSDIARGGWRTIICTDEDEYLVNTSNLFREVFVLAYTQHLKNKDIYEGGSKLTVVLDASNAKSREAVTQRLYKLQYGFINAFLDIFVTDNGKAKDRRVMDYYCEDEPIELGPDENMHETMIELIAQQSVKRGYLLGIGIMSSKRVGINHKEYGVTSRGVVKFAEIAMKELGIDIHHDDFSVKITGGTNGDVAGNAMRLLLKRCPRARILAIAAGSGALFDPRGVNRKALKALVLKRDVVEFNPRALSPGGFIIFRHQQRMEGVRELHRKLIRTGGGVEEKWITLDEFHREFEDLIFGVTADLFLPCGGRPETIDANNWQRFFKEDGTPAARVITEGANSYITPRAREEMQKKGVLILRDASANKCGVISSSYEIIANLLMTEKEFLIHKEDYVRGVLEILEKRAEDEARLIFKRYKEKKGSLLLTEISDAISIEINEHYEGLFRFFQERPELADQRVFRKMLLNHLPSLIRKTPKYRARIKRLPPKIKSAILASEVASSIVYRGGWELDLESRLRNFLKHYFST